VILSLTRASGGRRAFVLLDVILSITILSIVALTALRSFHMSLRSVRHSEIAERAAMYADAKLQEIELAVPTWERADGCFADDPFYADAEMFPDAWEFSWEADVEEIEIGDGLLDYPHVRMARRDEDQTHPLTQVRLQVFHDDGPGGMSRRMVVELETFLLGAERFTNQARRLNELY
jgi:hypothetical protein